jgi:protein-tyrosine-phosphatase
LGEFLEAVGDPPRRTAAGSNGPRQPDYPDVQEISDEEEGPAPRQTHEDKISQATEALEAVSDALEAKTREIDALRRKKQEIQRAPARDLEKLLKDLVAGPNEEEIPDPAKEQKRQVTERRQALVKESEALKTKIAREKARLEALEAERARARQLFLGESEDGTETQRDGEDVWKEHPEEHVAWLQDEDVSNATGS